MGEILKRRKDIEMRYQIINQTADIIKEMDFENAKEAADYILKNAYKFSCWSILKEDIVIIAEKREDGYYIVGNVNLHNNEVFLKSA